MTSRLKHKLDLEQVNLKSAYLNESFVQVRRFLSSPGSGSSGYGLDPFSVFLGHVFEDRFRF